MKVLLTSLFVLAVGFLAGCASHSPRVDCQSHLKPINAPAPASSRSESP